jgi:hypothetical protein
MADMNFENEFPLKFCINLARREDRRNLTEIRMREAGIQAERFSAIDGSSRVVRQAPADGRSKAIAIRGYESAGRYALALTQRLAIREAARRGAPAVMLFEDDVVFHPNFRNLIDSVELPEDWGIFYLGCTHNDRPVWAGPRIVRTPWASDTHAVAIRREYYHAVMDVLDRHGKPDMGIVGASDQYLASLHASIPTYACYPNLAWQDVSDSDLIQAEYSNYNKDGRQRNSPAAVDQLLGELIHEAPPPEPDAPRHVACPSPKVGLLFLTRGDVNHPDIWREYIAAHPESVRVFCHPKHQEQLAGGFLDGTSIPENFETSWGDISLVRATRALLLNALQAEDLTHFVLLSESTVPVRPLRDLLLYMKYDGRAHFLHRTLEDSPSAHAARIKAAPDVPAGCWRFQSQWWLLDRTMATIAADVDFTGQFEKMFVPDESYFATVLAMQGCPLEGEVVGRDITWTYWGKYGGSPDQWSKVPKDILQEIIGSGAMFARKFPVGSDIGTYKLHLSDS